MLTSFAFLVSKIGLTTCTLFFVSNAFISNGRLELAKNQAKGKQHPEAELWVFENHWLFSSLLWSKNNRTYSKKCEKKTKNKNKKAVYRLIARKMKRKKKNRSHRYYINRPRSWHEYKYTEYKMFSSMMVFISYQVTTESQFMKKLRDTQGWVWKKGFLIKKACSPFKGAFWNILETLGTCQSLTSSKLTQKA